jgi:hypothetical protein
MWRLTSSPGSRFGLADSPAAILEDLSDLEADHKGIPILLQQYLNLDGKVLELNGSLAPCSSACKSPVRSTCSKENRRVAKRLGEFPNFLGQPYLAAPEVES